MLEFIAANITDNIRVLEGALIRVSAFASLTHEPLTVERATQVLADLLSENQPRPITPKLILEETSKQFGFTVEEIISKHRQRPLVTARQIAMYVMRELTELSYPNIAREFGGRDHTTVIHAVEKIGAPHVQGPADLRPGHPAHAVRAPGDSAGRPLPARAGGQRRGSPVDDSGPSGGQSAVLPSARPARTAAGCGSLGTGRGRPSPR